MRGLEILRFEKNVFLTFDVQALLPTFGWRAVEAGTGCRSTVVAWNVTQWPTDLLCCSAPAPAST